MHMRILGVELYDSPPSIDVPPIGDKWVRSSSV